MFGRKSAFLSGACASLLSSHINKNIGLSFALISYPRLGCVARATLAAEEHHATNFITLRAILPQDRRQVKRQNETPLSSYYGTMLERRLMESGMKHVTQPSATVGSVEFLVDGDNQQLADICRTLPATQLWLVVSRWKVNVDDAKHVTQLVSVGTLERVIDTTWKTLGNKDQSKPSTFSISYKRQASRRRGCDRSLPERSLSKHLSEWMSQSLGWKPLTTPSSDPTFSFRLVMIDGNSCSLELLAMDRTWTLPNPFQPPSIGRLESFVVAKSARIRPHDVVWDPFCQRGTFLVEAAKYWPTAAYHGTDSNIGNLQHCQMNAHSTRTHLYLYHQQSSRGAAVNQMKDALAEKGESGVDKILTNLPPKQTSQFYREVLQDWSHLFQNNATLSLIVDVTSLPQLREAVDLLAGFRVTFVRKPPFLWGRNQRSTLVIIGFVYEANSQTVVTDKATPAWAGLLDWEEEILATTINNATLQSISLAPGSATLQLWAKARADTIPWMIPYSDRKVPQSRIRLENGKFK